jgi:hypothetical protein
VSNPTKETNKYVELVRKSLANPYSVSFEELRVNKEAAYAAMWAADDATRDAIVFLAAVAAYEAADYAARVLFPSEDITKSWSDRCIAMVKEFDKLTSKQAK